MSFIIELNGLFTFMAIFALWLGFFRYVVPKKTVSAPEVIGRAIGFFIITEITLSVLLSLVIAAIRKNFEIPLLIEALYIFKLIGFLIVAIVGSLLSMKTNENTYTMNLKIYSAIIFIPNILVSSLSFGSGNLIIFSILCVPLFSIVSGYFALKKYPQNYINL